MVLSSRALGVLPRHSLTSSRCSLRAVLQNNCMQWSAVHGGNGEIRSLMKFKGALPCAQERVYVVFLVCTVAVSSSEHLRFLC